MMPVKAPPSSRAASAASWTRLVAQTAGFTSMSVVSVRLLCAVSVPEGARLIVQELDSDAREGDLPLASMQRVLTRGALAGGLDVQLFRTAASGGATRVQAWIDTRGDEELDFDGLHATSAGALWVGRAEVRRDRATLVLEPAQVARAA